LNSILQSNSKTENLQLFRRIFYKVKEIKRRRPYWKLNYAFRKFSYPDLKKREILDKIQVEKSFLENLHLFQTIKDHRLQKGKRWLYHYRLLNLHKLTIYGQHSFEYEILP